MSVSEVFGSMGIVGLSVMVCLLGLSVYSFSVILGKYRRFRAAAFIQTGFNHNTFSRNIRRCF